MPQQQQRPNRNKGNRKQRRDAVSPFLEPLTRKTLRHELKAERRLAFGPQQRELKGEVRAESKYRDRLRDYFANYGTAVDQAAQRSQAAYATGVDQANAAGAAATAADSAVRDRIEAEARADAERRGATYTPSVQSVDASTNRRDSAALMAGLIAAQGSTQAAYLADKSRIGAGEKRDQLQRSHARSRSLDSDQRELAVAKRDYAKDYIARARDSEREYDLQRRQLRQTRQGQKLSAKTSRKNAQLSAATQRRGQNITQAHNAQTEAIAQQNANTSRGNLKQRRAEERYDRRHPSSSGGDGKNVQTAVAYLRNYANGLKPNERNKITRQSGIDYLVAHGYPRSIAVKALDKLAGGGGGGSNVAGQTPGPAGP